MKRLLLFFAVALSCAAFSQKEQDTTLVNAEQRLLNKLNALRDTSNSNEEKEAFNEAFKKELLNTFQLKGMFTYPFPKLTTVGSVTSSDNTLRLFNWNVEQRDFTQKYYCYVVYKNPRNNDISVNELVEQPGLMSERPDKTLTADHWYGALYYSIIPVEKSGKTYYTLLGWNGNSLQSNIKLIDVLYFSGDKVKLGYNLFKKDKEFQKRILFEYKEDAKMSLRYEAAKSQIIFDHLSPEAENLAGFYEYYVPDMSYDGLSYNKSCWEYENDILGFNPEDTKKITVYTLNKKDGSVEAKEMKREWINPSSEKGKEQVIPSPTDEQKQADEPKKSTKPKGKNRPGSILQNGQ